MDLRFKLVVLTLLTILFGAPTVIQAAEWDVMADNQVGIFYFLWLGQHRTHGPYDTTNVYFFTETKVQSDNFGFSEPVAGFDSSEDLLLHLTGSASVGHVGVTGGQAGPYTVTLSGITCSVWTWPILRSRTGSVGR